MEKDLARELNSRHVQMLAIGGAIGTGLFLGAGTAIKQAGPSIMVAYLLAALFTYWMLRAVGELVLSDTSKNSFIEFVRAYLGPKWEFVVGWTYWLCWESLAMTNLTASGIYVRFWFPAIPQWVTSLGALLLLLVLNLASVGLFGKLESAFASIKLIAIAALILTGIIMLFGGQTVGGHQVALQNLVDFGGFFPHKFIGMLTCLPMVIFAYTGIEMVGLTSGETRNPEKNIPRAINSVGPMISFCYIGALFVLMCIVPWNEISASSSPFVQVFSLMGVKAAAGIINFVVLTAALSSCNSAIFSTSRIIHSLAKSEQAPVFFGKTNKSRVPVNALLFSTVFLLIIVGLNFVLPAQIFTIISGVATVSFIFVWLTLLICHIKMRSIQGRKGIFPMPLYPLSSWLTIAFFLMVLVLLLFTADTRISLFCAIIWFAALTIGCSLFYAERRSKKDDEN